MELAQFWYLKSLADAGSLGAAARRCGVPRATLERAVAELERELRVAILRRAGSRVGLTPFGVRIIDHVDAIMSGVAAIQRVANTTAPDGRYHS